MFNESHREQLSSGMKMLGGELTDKQLDQSIAFLKMLVKWNRVYNLSAIKAPEAMISLHMLDSLAISPFLQGKRCVDVGTGAGLPGIPLAIINSDINFTLLDSNSKKTRFIQQVCIELGLSNIEPMHARVESFQPQQKFDTVTARAFTSLPELLTKTRHLLVKGGKLLAMKSKELDAIEHNDFLYDSVQELVIPSLDVTRHVVIYTAQ